MSKRIHTVSNHTLAVILIVCVAFLSLLALFSSPQQADAIVCGTGSNVSFTDIGGGNCFAQLTSGNSFTVPTDWQASGSSIRAIGGGGGGGDDDQCGWGCTGGGGGGGGGYSGITNASLTGGAIIYYSVGAGGAGGTGTGNGTSGGSTYFCSSSANCGAGAALVSAGGGSLGTWGSSGGGSGGAGGAAIVGTGFSGGSGGNGGPSGGTGAGGGAAGPNGAGGSGVSTGGRGDNNTGGLGGAYPSCGATGGTGGDGTEISGLTGGGGGGGAGNGSTGGIGGYWGGGGGGGGVQGVGCAAFTTGGAGQQGVIIIVYAPAPPLPGAPGTPSFSSVTHNSMRVSWTAATDATTYKVERCSGAGCSSFSEIATGVATLYFDDSGLSPSTSYTYRIRATNVTGNGSYSSSASQSTTAAPAPPGAPGTPTFSNLTQTSMRVSWTAGSGATTYKVERCSGGGCSSFGEIATGLAVLLYDDSGLTPGTSYTYRVRGTNAQGDGAYSGNGTQSTDSPPGGGGGSWWWSDTIGWISATCQTGGPTNNNICATSNYGIGIDGSGNMSGYAWSENIGWISAEAADVVGCPAGTCQPRIVGGVMMGWMRAIGADNNGWDGWISLNCLNTGTCGAGSYGVTSSSGSYSGYAWGSDVIGWLDFQYMLPPPAQCSLTPTSQLIVLGSTANLAWTSTSATSGYMVPVGALSTASNANVLPTATTTYTATFGGPGGYGSCQATVNVRCAQTARCNDVNPQQIEQLNTDCSVTPIGSPCVGPATCVPGFLTCQVPPIDFVAYSATSSGHLKASPRIVRPGLTSQLIWNVINASSCTVSGNGNSWTMLASGETGQTSNAINSSEIYTMDCTPLPGAPSPEHVIETVTIVPSPIFNEE